jgi:hypothetical protein
MGTLEKEIKFTRHPQVRISNNRQVRISVFFFRSFVCSESGNLPKEDVKKVTIILRKILAKFGYKRDRKYRALFLLCLSLHQNQI